jgi:hypothetical protein
VRIFIGGTRDLKYLAECKKRGIGRVSTPDCAITPYAGESVFLDNGAFSCWRRGVAFERDRYMKFLSRQVAKSPAWLVVPDIVASGLYSLEFSLEWMDSGELPSEVPWYLALQDGMSYHDVVESVSTDPRIAGVFLGGTLRHKGENGEWISALAHQAGKRAHFGRCGVPDRLLLAHRFGFDSADSSVPLWERARATEFFSLVEGGAFVPGRLKQTSFFSKSQLLALDRQEAQDDEKGVTK